MWLGIFSGKDLIVSLTKFPSTDLDAYEVNDSSYNLLSTNSNTRKTGPGVQIEISDARTQQPIHVQGQEADAFILHITGGCNCLYLDETQEKLTTEGLTDKSCDMVSVWDPRSSSQINVQKAVCASSHNSVFTVYNGNGYSDGVSSLESFANILDDGQLDWMDAPRRAAPTTLTELKRLLVILLSLLGV